MTQHFLTGYCDVDSETEYENNEYVLFDPENIPDTFSPEQAKAKRQTHAFVDMPLDWEARHCNDYCNLQLFLEEDISGKLFKNCVAHQKTNTLFQCVSGQIQLDAVTLACKHPKRERSFPPGTILEIPQGTYEVTACCPPSLQSGLLLSFVQLI